MPMSGWVGFMVTRDLRLYALPPVFRKHHVPVELLVCCWSAAGLLLLLLLS